MLKSYVKIALRSLRKHKTYALINLVGLAVGLAVCLAIALYVRHELSYDRFHEKADRLYRVTRTDTTEGEVSTSTTHPAPLGPALTAALPGVKKATRFEKTPHPVLVQQGARSFYEDGILYADSTLFDAFSFELLSGSPKSALTRPYTVVLSASMAQKYFGRENPVGETIAIREANRTFEVTGVAEDAPPTSSIQYGFIASFATQYAEQRNMMVEYAGGWNMAAFPTYLVLQSGASEEGIAATLPSVLKQRAGESGYFVKSVDHTRYGLEPITDVHLYSAAENNLGPSSDIRYVYIFGTIALLILIVASINYMNLATARAARRAREVGVRKTVGATRGQLARQFLGESVLMCGAAALLAFLTVRLTLPVFSQLTGVELEAEALTAWPFLLSLLGAVLLVGFVSGSYPALVLSRFRAADVTRGHAVGRSGARFRQGLVVFQFAISVALLAGAAIVWSQLGYVQSKRLGLNEKQVLVISNRGALNGAQVQVFKEEVKKQAGVEEVAVGSAMPTEGAVKYSTQVEGQDRGESGMMSVYNVDTDYLEALGIELAAGRNFSAVRSTDPDSAIILNETAARKIGWQDPVGKKISYGGQEARTVVGVVKDFHYESLHSEIGPLFMTLITPEQRLQYLAVRVRTDNLSRVLSSIEDTWNQLTTAYPLDYFFLEEAFARLYESEQRIASLFTLFFALVVFVACIGLFGLAAYTVERRTKEIGIRKVLGASAASVVALVSKEFALLVGVAFVLAVPVAYLGARRWLEDFAYRVDLGAGPFLLAGGVVLAVALGVVGYQALRAAQANPVDALRQE